MKYSDVENRIAQHVCIFGEPKTGKSSLAASIARSGFTLHWFSLDNGHIVLRELPQVDKDRLELYVIPDNSAEPVAIKTIRSIMRGAQTKFCVKHGRIGCPFCLKEAAAAWEVVDAKKFTHRDVIVIDSGSQLVDSAIAMITNSHKSAPEDVKFEYEDWRVLGYLMNDILSHIQNAPYNVIMITHPLEVKMEAGERRIVPLLGTTNFSANSAKYFDHVIYTEVENKKHKAGSSTTYKASVVTGSRTNVAIEKSPEASLAEFFTLVNIEKKEPVKDELLTDTRAEGAESNSNTETGIGGEVQETKEVEPEKEIQQNVSSPQVTSVEKESDKFKTLLAKLRQKENGE